MALMVIMVSCNKHTHKYSKEFDGSQINNHWNTTELLKTDKFRVFEAIKKVMECLYTFNVETIKNNCNVSDLLSQCTPKFCVSSPVGQKLIWQLVSNFVAQERNHETLFQSQLFNLAVSHC